MEAREFLDKLRKDPELLAEYRGLIGTQQQEKPKARWVNVHKASQILKRSRGKLIGLIEAGKLPEGEVFRDMTTTDSIDGNQSYEINVNAGFWGELPCRS